MIERIVDYFNLDQICQSGQCFRMHAEGENRYSVIAGKHYLELEQQGRRCYFDCDEAAFENFWKDYFDLGTDYGSYTGRVAGTDSYLRDAAAFGAGIRILRQDLWEMIVSFLISQQNHITRIRRYIDNICTGYGEILENGHGKAYHAFPTPQALAVLPEDALMACNLGYRSKYVVRAARSVAGGECSLATIRGLSYPEAKEKLLQLYGVGEKVADCICLYGLHHLEAFPVDTHIRQAMEAHYKEGFPMERYAGCQGVLQQYIFYYELAGNTLHQGKRAKTS